MGAAGCATGCDADQVCTPGLLLATPTFAVGDAPRSLTAADVNGDGAIDLIVCNQDSKDLSVLLGHGDGTFATQRRVTVELMDTTAVDLDHDGTLDLLGHALYSHDVVALFGNGDASFQPAKTLATFDDALHSLEIADLNGDGQLDIVVSFNKQTQIAVLPGNEDRSLGPAQRFELGERVGVIRIADFDRDQKPDLLLITAPIPGRARLGIMPGLGGGSFSPLQVADTGYSFDLALSVTVVDLNHDGKLDLVTRTGAVFLDIAASKLKEPVFNPFGSQVVVGDLGADGELDLAEVDSDDNRITVFNGDGTGAFTRPAKFSAVSVPGALAIADFNADGRSDLAIMSNSSDSVSVRLSGTGPGNIGVGGFADPFTFSTPMVPRSVAVADFDGNGELDLVVSNAIPSGGDSLPDNGVSLEFGAGNGVFRSGPTLAAGTSPLQVAAADLNGDQQLDVVVANGLAGKGATVLLGNGHGTFQTARHFDTDGPSPALAVGDLDGDGSPDLAVANTGTNSIAILIGTGTGDFDAARNVNLSAGVGPSLLSLADLNGDGALDLVSAPSDASRIDLSFGTGDGSFSGLQKLTIAAYGRPFSLTVADLNGDTKPDLLYADLDKIGFLLGNGDGTFAADQTLERVTGTFYITTADVNGDGAIDLINTRYNFNDACVWLGDGRGAFAEPHCFGVSAGPNMVAIADLNRDGRADLITPNARADTVSVLLGSGRFECR